MKSNRYYLMTLLCMLGALLPIIFLRDINSWNEINYIALAKEAFENTSFFAFTLDGEPYTTNPPFYLWLCTLAFGVLGNNAAIALSLFAVLCLLFIIVLFDRSCGVLFSHQDRLLIMVGMCSLFSLMMSSIAVGGDILFAAILLTAYMKLVHRYECLQTEKYCKLGNIAIPLLISLAIFTKGLLALAFIVIALFLLMLYRHDIKRFFKVFRPYYFILIFFCGSLWYLGLVLEIGQEEAFSFFWNTLQSPFVLTESVIAQPNWYYLVVVPLMLFPLSLTFIYFCLRVLITREKLSLRTHACFFFSVGVLLCLAFAPVKFSSMALPAIPAIYYFIVLCYRECLNPLPAGTRDKGIEFVDHSSRWLIEEERRRLPRLFYWSIALPLTICMLLFVAYFVFYDKYVFLQDSLVGIACCILGFISLVALVLLSCRFFLFCLAVEGVAILSFFFCIGWAMPYLNSFCSLGNMASVLSKAINEGGSRQVCLFMTETTQYLPLYENRLVLKHYSHVSEQDFEHCLVERSSIVFSRTARLEHPQEAHRLKALGALRLGPDYILPSAKELSSLSRREKATACQSGMTEDCSFDSISYADQGHEQGFPRLHNLQNDVGSLTSGARNTEEEEEIQVDDALVEQAAKEQAEAEAQLQQEKMKEEQTAPESAQKAQLKQEKQNE